MYKENEEHIESHQKELYTKRQQLYEPCNGITICKASCLRPLIYGISEACC